MSLRLACGALAVAIAVVRAQPPPPNVLLITIDTVRADRIGAYGYAKGSTPTFDRLAREGVRFADATTQAPLTGPAHAALLTGVYPARFGIRDNATTPLPDEATTIAEVFKARGYQTGGFIGAFIVDAQYGFAQGFDTFDASFPKFNAGMKLQARRRGGDVVDAAVRWLGMAADRPFFAWVHLYDAHAPYEPPPPYRGRFSAAPYDGAVAYLDACAGRLVAALEQSGRLDRTIVVVVADHGEGLGEHGEHEHGLFLYDAVLHVPWIMRLPGHRWDGTIVKDQVRTIDVMPTVAELAGAVISGSIDGESVVGLIRGDTRRDTPPSYAETYYPKRHFGWSELTSVRIGDWKYIDAPRAELYDLRKDPGERQTVLDARPALVKGLAAELGKIQFAFGPAAVAEAPQPDRETLARLRSLGYVGIAAPAPGGRGVDPKDMVSSIELFRTGISHALEAMDRRQPDIAIQELKRLIVLNDRSYELHLFIGDAYAAKKQYDTALGEYAAAKVLYPQSATPVVAIARVYLAQGDTARALEQLQAADALEPGSGEIALVRGLVFEKRQQGVEALAAYRAAVHANESDTQARAHLAGLALRMNELDAAQQQFEALLAMGYRPAQMHFGLGQVAQARGDPKRAEAEYRLALKIEPGFADARNELSKMGAGPMPAGRRHPG
jgi:arylsulfatase A-like enzyme/tetratricopeptide (TPR) repeat protein